MVAIHSVLASLPLLVGGGLVSAACVGSGCLGLNPSNEGCWNDAREQKFFSDGYLYVGLWYSQTCRAWWAQATCSSNAPLTDTLYVNVFQFYGRQTYSQRIVNPHRLRCVPGNPSHTYMLNDRDSGDYYNACWSYGTWNTQQSPTESNNWGCLGRHPNPN